MEDTDGSNNLKNKNQAQNNRKKKAPGVEWQYAINIGDRFIDWECKLCHAIKSGGAPRLRDHFVGGPKKTRTCTHPSAPMVANRIREEHRKKEVRNYYAPTTNVHGTEEQHASNQQTPQPSPDCTPNPSTQPGSSSSKHYCANSKVSMRQTSLQESLRSTLHDEAQLALAEAVYFSGSAMMMVDNDHWKKAWKKIGEFGVGFSLPTYHSMQNDLLDKCYGQVKERVQRVILSNILLMLNSK